MHPPHARWFGFGSMLACVFQLPCRAAPALRVQAGAPTGDSSSGGAPAPAVPASVRQRVVAVAAEQKLRAVAQLAAQAEGRLMLVFADSQEAATGVHQWVSDVFAAAAADSRGGGASLGLWCGCGCCCPLVCPQRLLSFVLAAQPNPTHHPLPPHTPCPSALCLQGAERRGSPGEHAARRHAAGAT